MDNKIQIKREWRRRDIPILRPRMLMHGQSFPGPVYVSHFPFSVFWAGLLIEKNTIFEVSLPLDADHVSNDLDKRFGTGKQAHRGIPNPFAVHLIDSQTQASRILLKCHSFWDLLLLHIATLRLEEI